MPEQFARRISAFQAATANVFRILADGDLERRRAAPDAADFMIGNPHEMPLQGMVDAFQSALVPRNKNWFAYKLNEPASQRTVAESLKARYSIPFEPRDIHMTNGAFAALSVSLGTLVDEGDEVIFNTPPWFFYEGLIAGWGGVPVRVKVRADSLDLDTDAIAAAITPRTRAIIVNSPNNPTGVIYPEATLKKLAGILDVASKRNGRTIYMLSDESYSKILFDKYPFMTPTVYYPNSLLIYTYGKTLLAPGQRIGYIALPPTMLDRDALRNSLMAVQIMTGWSFPNALLQHSLADLEKQSIDLVHLQEKRDRMVSALRKMGYQVHIPQGTFYLMPRSPVPDDWAFSQLLADHKVFVLPGTVVELPGYFRISLTANDDMIDRGLPGFAAAIAKARSSVAS